MKIQAHLLSLLNSRERSMFVGICLLILFGAFLETSGIALIPVLVALLANPDFVLTHPILTSVYDYAQADSVGNFILRLSVGVLLLFIFKGIYLAFVSSCQFNFLRNKQVCLSSSLLNSYLRAPYSFHLRKNTAEVCMLLTSEVTKLFWNVFAPLFFLVNELIVLSSLIVLLTIVEPIPSLLAVSLLSVLLYVANESTKSFVQRKGLARQHHDSQIYKWINQSLGGIKETKVLGRESFFIKRFSFHKLRSEQATVSLEFMRQTFQLSIETIVVSAVLLFVIMALAQGQNINTVLPTISLFAIASLRIMPSAKRIISTITSIRYYSHIAEKIVVTLSELEEAPGSPSINKTSEKNDRNIFSSKADISVKDVFYHYPGAESDSLRGVSLNIPFGSSVAFIGPSGSGKTTLIDIILGLLTPVKGSVNVGIYDTRDNQREWQQQIGYIPQDIYLSDDTIRRNIAFGLVDEDISDEQVWTALHAAQLHKLVETLPKKLDTFVGERGVRLSGGQRQRIGIARALYRDPKVLVMDEATAALDNETEKDFMSALEELSKRRTLIMIAHRLTTIKNCDQIYCLDAGQITRSGKYKQLFASGVGA